MSRNTYNGKPGITGEFFSRRDEVTGRCVEPKSRRLTEDQIRELVRDELLAILEETAVEQPQ